MFLQEKGDCMKSHRTFLKADLWKEWGTLERDQKSGKPAPPPQKPYSEGVTLIDLVAPEDLTSGSMSVKEAIERRRSHRTFTGAPLTLEELSFLLWATQGVSSVSEQGEGQVIRTLRTVPSGGARHPFETYLLVNRVEGCEPGLYRYLPLEHKLYRMATASELAERVNDTPGTSNQDKTLNFQGAFIQKALAKQFAMMSAVVFIWTVIPYRTEWRYGLLSPKLIAQDSGHLCQNLYLASEAIGAGTCAVASYVQDTIDALLGVDGEDEFTIYVAPVGKIG